MQRFMIFMAMMTLAFLSWGVIKVFDINTVAADSIPIGLFTIGVVWYLLMLIFGKDRITGVTYHDVVDMEPTYFQLPEGNPFGFRTMYMITLYQLFRYYSLGKFFKPKGVEKEQALLVAFVTWLKMSISERFSSIDKDLRCMSGSELEELMLDQQGSVWKNAVRNEFLNYEKKDSYGLGEYYIKLVRTERLPDAARRIHYYFVSLTNGCVVYLCQHVTLEGDVKLLTDYTPFDMETMKPMEMGEEDHEQETS